MRQSTIPIPSLLLAATAVVSSMPSSCEGFVSERRPAKGRQGSRLDSAVASTKLSAPLLRRGYGIFNALAVDDESSDETMESKIMSMKVADLKAELKSHGQPVSGLKAVLQERLLDFYKNSIPTTSASDLEDIADTTQSEPTDSTDAEDKRLEDEDLFETFYIVDNKKEAVDDDFDDDDHHDQKSEGGQPESGENSWLLSKKKWKNKTFLLMEDVRKLVHSNDPIVRKRAPKKAREAVRRMQQWLSFRVSDFDDLDLTSDQRATLLKGYNLWIHALAKSGEHDAGFQAEKVLKEIQENVSRGGPVPDEVTIGSVMDAHAHSATVSSASGSGVKAAEAFLFRLLEKHEATTSQGDMPWSQDGDNALNDSLIVTCDTMLNALAREGTMESAERAQLIVLRLEEYQRQLTKRRKENRPNAIVNNPSGIDGTKTSNTMRKRPISYATVMNAWANVGSVEAAEKAETALESLVIRAKTDGNEGSNKHDEDVILVSVVPDTIVFNSVIQCWATARSIKSGKKSMRLLQQMKELSGMERIDAQHEDKRELHFDTHPDIITYNTILSAWSHCGDKNAAPKAEKIVKDLVQERERNKNADAKLGDQSDNQNSVVVNSVTFNTVLDAWSKSKLSGASDRAEKLLEFMIQSNDPEIAPDIYSFTCVMDAFAKSKEPNKAMKTRKLLDRLIQMHDGALLENNKRTADALRPTQIPYNTVLNACAFSAMNTLPEEKKAALQIAVETYKSMSSRISLPSFRRRGNGKIISRDTVTYGLMLKCIANLMPKGQVRSRMALQIFQECCDDGLVGFMVWNEIRRSVPSKLLQDSYGFRRQCGSLEVKDLPKEWRRYSKEKRFSNQRHQKQNDRHKKNKPKPSDDKPKNRTFIIERSFATGKDM